MRVTPHDSGAGEASVRAGLVAALVRSILALLVLALAASLLDPANDVRVSVAFYGATLLVVAALGVLARRGRVHLVAWCLTSFLWLLIALVTLFFGGLEGQNASVFSVCVVLAATLVGGRAALGLAIASSAWAWGLVALEETGRLPTPPVGYSPINSGIALTATLVLLSYLVRMSIDSLRELNERASAAARDRDEALRRSISAQKLQLVGSLTSGVAHDLNNLLMVVQSAAETLRAAGTTSDGKEALDDLEAATARMSVMTRQLLSFGRGTEGERSPFDVGAVVRALEPMLPRLLGSGVAVQVETVSGALVMATRAGLEQVLLNLAVNARDAMREGGRLTVRVGLEGQHVVLSVEDTGVGMDEATLRQAFDAFFTTKSTGTGLGLATVQRIVAGYGGSVVARSVVGAGTTFEVRIPRTAEPIPSREGPSPGHPRPHVARVLLVEDDALVRRSLLRMLEGAGFAVVAAADGVAALATLEEAGSFSVVVSDISMPGLDGESLARRLAALRPSLPVVLMSGNRKPDGETLDSPLREFVPKPVTQHTLLAAIERVVRPPSAPSSAELPGQAGDSP